MASLTLRHPILFHMVGMSNLPYLTPKRPDFSPRGTNSGSWRPEEAQQCGPAQCITEHSSLLLVFQIHGPQQAPLTPTGCAGILLTDMLAQPWEEVGRLGNVVPPHPAS